MEKEESNNSSNNNAIVPLIASGQYEELNKLQQESFISLLIKDSYCDYKFNNKWCVAQIISTEDNLFHILYDNQNIALTQSEITPDQITFFRKHTKPSSSLSTNKGNLQDLLDDLHLVINSKFDYASNPSMSPYTLIQLFRGKLMLSFDWIFNIHQQSQPKCTIDQSLQAIEAYLEMLTLYMIFIKENHALLPLLLKTPELCLVDWRCSLLSFYSDAMMILNKIFMIESSYFVHYNKNKYDYEKAIGNRFKNMKKMKEAANKGPKEKITPAMIISLSFEQLCIKDAYDYEKRVTKAKNLTYPAFISSYLVDYFNSIQGYHNIINLLKEINEAFTIKNINDLLIIYTYPYFMLNITKWPSKPDTLLIQQHNKDLLSSLTDATLRDLSKETITFFIEKTALLSKYTTDASDDQSKVLLYQKTQKDLFNAYHYQCLLSGILEKKLQAINYFATLVKESNYNRCFDKNDKSKKENSEMLVSFFKESKVIEMILGEDFHEEVLKRSLGIVGMMYQFDWGLKEGVKEYTRYVVGKLWRYVEEKHFGLSESVEGVICDMVRYADEEDKWFFYERIKEEVMKAPCLTKESFRLLMEITENCLRKNDKSIVNQIDLKDNNEITDNQEAKENKEINETNKDSKDTKDSKENKDNKDNKEAKENNNELSSEPKNNIEESKEDLLKQNNDNNDDFLTEDHINITLNEKELYGVKLFWDFMEDSYLSSIHEKYKHANKYKNKHYPDPNIPDSSLTSPIQIISLSIETILNLLRFLSDSIRLKFLSLSILNISTNQNSIQSLIFIKHLLSQNRYFRQYKSLLQTLNQSPHYPQGIFHLLINNLNLYLLKATTSIASSQLSPSEDMSTQVFEGFYDHNTNINTRIESIILLISNKYGFTLSKENFFSLWSSLSISPVYAELFNNIILHNMNIIDYMVLEQYFTNIIISSEKYMITTMQSYTLFMRLFNEINQRLGNFIYVNARDRRVNPEAIRDNQGIVGERKLWELVKEGNDENKLQSTVASLLCELCLNVSTLQKETVEFYWDGFIRKLTEEITIADETKNENSIKGLLLVLKNIMENTGAGGEIACWKSEYYKGQSRVYSAAYQHMEKDTVKVGALEVFDEEMIGSVRMRLSKEFRIQSNKVVIEIGEKRFDWGNDVLIWREEVKEGNEMIVMCEDHPMMRMERNPRKMLIANDKLVMILIDLLQDYEKSYITNIASLIGEFQKCEEFEMIIQSIGEKDYGDEVDNEQEIKEELKTEINKEVKKEAEDSLLEIDKEVNKEIEEPLAEIDKEVKKEVEEPIPEIDKEVNKEIEEPKTEIDKDVGKKQDEPIIEKKEEGDIKIKEEKKIKVLPIEADDKKELIEPDVTISIDLHITNNQIKHTHQSTSIINNESIILFNNKNIYFMSYVLTRIKNVLNQKSTENPLHILWLSNFSKSQIYSLILTTFHQSSLHQIKLLQEFHCLTDIIDIISKVFPFSPNSLQNKPILPKLLSLINDIFEDSYTRIDSHSQLNEFSSRQSSLMTDILRFITRNSFEAFIDLIIDRVVNEDFVKIITKGTVLSKNKEVNLQFLSMILSIMNNEGIDVKRKESLLKYLYELMLDEENIQQAINYNAIENIAKETEEKDIIAIAKAIEEDEKEKERENGKGNKAMGIEENFYFTIITTLIDQCFDLIHYDYCALACNLFKILEKDHEQSVDITGYIILLNAILRHSNQITLEISSKYDIYTSIFEKCLFTKCCLDPSSQPLPKCLSESSRKAAYDLLVILLFNNPNEDLKHKVFTELNSYHYLNTWRRREYSYWKLSYHYDTTAKSDYVGLKNLGCTCYMNCIIQSLYMIPQLREALISYECPMTPNSFFYQLKSLMLSLKYSENQYLDTSSFFHNLGNEGIKMGEQMDIDEFFIFLIEKIEESMKGSANADLIRHYFQGRNSDELIFKKGCKHHRSNDFSYYSMMLHVKNKKSIYESLDSLIEGEVMDGDNKIYCSHCDSKYPAIKRQSFKVLPRILLFVLKRFEFDYSTMTKTKVNDYYEFPFDLDMTKYITNDNKGEINGKYKLKNVVIHRGHSEGGHYYAYMKDYQSEDWYEFNDTLVRKFNVDDLKAEAYGGYDTYTHNNRKDYYEKNQNAYLLFYEKEDVADCELYPNVSIDNPQPNTNINIDCQKIIEKINIDNSHCWIQKTIFNSAYQQFLLELTLNSIRAYNSPESFDICYNLGSRTVYFLSDISPSRNSMIISSNLMKLIKQNQFLLLNASSINKSLMFMSAIEKLFPFYCGFFFNVLLRSAQKPFLASSVEFIKFCMFQAPECAKWLLEEFTNADMINEFLIETTLANSLRKVIVGILFAAMVYFPNDNSIKGIDDTLIYFLDVLIGIIKEKKGRDIRFIYYLIYRFTMINQKATLFLVNSTYLLEYLVSHRQFTNEGNDTYLKMRDDCEMKLNVKVNLQDNKDNVVNALSVKNYKPVLYKRVRKMNKVSLCSIERPCINKKENDDNDFRLFNDDINENSDGDDDDEDDDNNGKDKPNKPSLSSSSINTGGTEDYLYILICKLLSYRTLKSKIFDITIYDDKFILHLLHNAHNSPNLQTALVNMITKVCSNNKDMLKHWQNIFMNSIKKYSHTNIEQTFLAIFKSFLCNYDDSLKDLRIKSSLEKYISAILDLENNNSVFTHIEHLLKFFNNEKIRKYAPSLKSSISKCIKWLKGVLEDINDGRMRSRSDELKAKVQSVMDGLGKIIEMKNEVIDEYDDDKDFTDFPFVIGDNILIKYNSGTRDKEEYNAVVISQMDEMIEVEINKGGYIHREWFDTDSAYLFIKKGEVIKGSKGNLGK